MAFIACGQNEIMPDTCPECGGWVHADLDDGTPSPGFRGPHGWLFCSEARDPVSQPVQEHTPTM